MAPPKFFRSLSESPTQTIDSSPCCKTGPTSGPPKWKCLAPSLDMAVLICIETIIEYWFNYSFSSKFSSAKQTLKHSDDRFIAQDVLYNAGNILPWFYLSLVGVHLLGNPRKFYVIFTYSGPKIPQNYIPNAFFLYWNLFLICKHR